MQQLRNWGSSIPEWDQYAAAAGARRGVHKIEDRIGAVPVSDRNRDRDRGRDRNRAGAGSVPGSDRNRDPPSPVSLDPTADLDRGRRPWPELPTRERGERGKGETPARPDSTPTAIRRHDADSTAPSWSNLTATSTGTADPSGPA